MKFLLLLPVILVSISIIGCISPRMEELNNAVDQLEIGSRLDEVIASLQVLQDEIPKKYQRSPIRYIDQRGVDVYIYFVRVQIGTDTNALEELYIPLIFHGDVLVGIGWEAIDRAMK